jgi:membrane peptidoglycan carboxypeptidase
MRVRDAFARSSNLGVLNAAIRWTTEAELGDLLKSYGIRVPADTPIRTATTMGTVEATPSQMLQIAQSISAWLAGRQGKISRPQLIDHVLLRDDDGSRRKVVPPTDELAFAKLERYLTSRSREFFSRVMGEVVRSGTLRSLSAHGSLSDVQKIWAKTGTVSGPGGTRHAWIVGGLLITGRPFSFVCLVSEPKPDRHLGRVTASDFAPLAASAIKITRQIARGAQP